MGHYTWAGKGWSKAARKQRQTKRDEKEKRKDKNEKAIKTRELLRLQLADKNKYVQVCMGHIQYSETKQYRPAIMAQ